MRPYEKAFSVVRVFEAHEPLALLVFMGTAWVFIGTTSNIHLAESEFAYFGNLAESEFA
jgi:hypothetical protein